MNDSEFPNFGFHYLFITNFKIDWILFSGINEKGTKREKGRNLIKLRKKDFIVGKILNLLTFLYFVFYVLYTDFLLYIFRIE